jgi:hypothetical protein
MNKKVKVKMTITRPSYGDNKQRISITVTDNASHIQFLDLEMKLDDFACMMTGLAHVEAIGEARGLENVGKTKESKELIFELPNDTYSAREVAPKTCQNFADPGWTASPYFNSQNSFFKKDDKQFARTHQYRFVERKTKSQK